MRVIAGAWRGRRLVAPAGSETRPTGDRAREALFSILGAAVKDADVLDLYAGSGALGLEALSRGAARATFVERAAAALAAIRANCEHLDVEASRVELQSRDCAAFVHDAAARAEKYDLIFIDPPYATPLGALLTRELPALLAPDARLVCESDRAAGAQFALPVVRERRYGNTLIRIHSP
ncbi:MAG: 16S rRNA (guanine(966)-N(2))-methyltransferase RsmD [Solirubrobacteraceae bacterium]